MVEAILEASARIFGEVGFAAATTNRIAQRCGVSVGSLYQYFPNKEALVRVLYASHVRRVLDAATAAVDRSGGLSLAEGLDGFVRAFWDEHQAHPGLHQVLELEFPARHFLPLGQDLRPQMERLLAAHRSEVARADLRVAAGIALDLIRSLVHTAILDVRQAWREVEPVREIRRAVLGYLATPAP
jgi:AcrR family transcriptional regulator